jgi:hypothetical protein
VETGSRCAEKLRCWGHAARSWGLHWRAQTAGKAWPLDGNIQDLTKFPLRGECLYSSSRGSQVICPTRRDFIYIALGLDGNSSIQTAS